MCVRVHGQYGQDDGNKCNEGDVENHGRTGQKLLIGTWPVNLQFPLFSVQLPAGYVKITAPPNVLIQNDAIEPSPLTFNAKEGGRRYPQWQQASAKTTVCRQESVCPSTGLPAYCLVSVTPGSTLTLPAAGGFFGT